MKEIKLNTNGRGGGRGGCGWSVKHETALVISNSLNSRLL